MEAEFQTQENQDSLMIEEEKQLFDHSRVEIAEIKQLLDNQVEAYKHFELFILEVNI